MGNSISNHSKKEWLYNRPSQNFQIFLPVIHFSTSGQNVNFSLIQFVFLDLWPVKDNPYRPMPGGQKLRLCLTVFHKNYNILKTLCQISLKIWSLLNFRVLNQNMMVKRDEFKWNIRCFNVLGRFGISENCLKWSVTNGILRMWHTW